MKSDEKTLFKEVIMNAIASKLSQNCAKMEYGFSKWVKIWLKLGQNWAKTGVVKRSLISLWAEFN